MEVSEDKQKGGRAKTSLKTSGFDSIGTQRVDITELKFSMKKRKKNCSPYD